MVLSQLSLRTGGKEGEEKRGRESNGFLEAFKNYTFVATTTVTATDEKSYLSPTSPSLSLPLKKKKWKHESHLNNFWAAENKKYFKKKRKKPAS